MPPLDIVLTSWTVNWPALALLTTAVLLYARGLRAARQRRIRWPWRRTATFYALGLGSFAVLSFGFTGVYSHDLRWVFTLKITSYLFIVPLLLTAGKPLTLARATLGPAGTARLDRFLAHPVMRALSNTVVAALLGLGIFTLFLTPLFHPLRTDPFWDMALTVLVPLTGMLMVVPIIEDASSKTVSALIIVEFIYVFIELVADAVPGIMMRISPQILDGATVPLTGHPGWLRDRSGTNSLLVTYCGSWRK